MGMQLPKLIQLATLFSLGTSDPAVKRSLLFEQLETPEL